jgi:hypothetical protein
MNALAKKLGNLGAWRKISEKKYITLCHSSPI